jgi:hypothetical protein
MTPFENPLVEEYMNRLRTALAGLPDGRCDEITEAIAQHIAEAWSELGNDSEAAIRTMLDHLGEPEGIAADALEGELTERLTSPQGRSHRTRIRRFVIAGVVLAAVVLGSLFAFVITPRPRPSTTGSPGIPIKHAVRPTLVVTVPNVIGLTGYRASVEMRAAGLRFIVKSVPATSGHPPGLVARQAPPAGAQIAAGATVGMAVATAPPSSTTSTIMAPTTTTITTH